MKLVWWESPFLIKKTWLLCSTTRFDSVVCPMSNSQSREWAFRKAESIQITERLSHACTFRITMFLKYNNKWRVKAHSHRSLCVCSSSRYSTFINLIFFPVPFYAPVSCALLLYSFRSYVVLVSNVLRTKNNLWFYLCREMLFLPHLSFRHKAPRSIHVSFAFHTITCSIRSNPLVVHTHSHRRPNG